MELGRLLRIWLPPLLLGLLAFGAWQVADRFDFEEVGGQEEPYSLTTETPLFSARRIPMTIRVPINEEAVAPAVQEALDETDRISGTTSCLIVIDGNRVVGPSEDPDMGMVPASNQKLLTTYAALGLLGTDFRFRTTVRAAAPVEDGAVTDLYLVGDGDPFLYTDDWLTQYDTNDGRYSTRLEDLADAVAAAGVTRVTGTLYGDESLYDRQRTVSTWHPRLIDQNQSGPLSALTVNENFVDWPEVFQESFRPRSPTDNPPLQAASVFAQLLTERGVTVAGTGAQAAPEGAVEVAAVESPRLAEVVTHVNSYSSNLGAELLVKRIGYETSGQGTTAAGVEAVSGFLQAENIPTDGLSIMDGSGLAESDRVTCTALVTLLARSGPGSDLASSLAISGARGSLADRFAESDAAGLVWAKTGTLRGVKALSGFARSSSEEGAGLAFSYIVNGDVVDDTPLAVQDELMASLVNYPAGPTLDVIGPFEAEPAD